MKSAKTIAMMALILAISASFSYGWIHTHYYPPNTDVTGPASRTFLTMKAFTDLILQNMVLHQFDPDFKNIAIASMDHTYNGIPIQFQLYMKQAKVDPDQTFISQTNNTYVINSKNVNFDLQLHLTVNGRNYDIPAHTNNAEFSIFFEMGFDEQGLIYVNSTNTDIDIKTYIIPAGFFDAELDKSVVMEVPLPEELRHIPLDALMSVITASFEDQLTKILRSWLTDIQVYDTISLDRNFTGLPSMAGGKVMIERNMFFYNNQAPKARPNIAPPTVFPKRDDLSHKQEETLMVNEYFFNSLFYAMHDASMLQFTLTNNNIPIESKQKLTVYQADRVIPGLKQQFVYDLPMIATFKTLAHPKTTILGEVFFLREPKVMTKVELEMNLFVDSPTEGQVLIGTFEITSYVELSMRIDVNQLFLYFDGVQIQDFKIAKQGLSNINLDAERIKNAVHRLFLVSIPRLTNFLMLSHGIKLMPFDNVELINSITDIAPNHISTQTDLFIFDINKNPYQSFPAAKLRIQNRLFDELKDYLLEHLIPEVNGMRFPDQFLGSKFGCSVTAEDLHIPQFSIDIANTYFRGNDLGNFNIHISQFKIEGAGRVKAEERIKILFWKIKLFTITVGLDVVSDLTSFDASVKVDLDQDGQLRAQLQNININWDFSFHLRGGFWAKIVDFVIHHIGLHNTIKNMVLKKMNGIVTNMIQNALTNALKKELIIDFGNNLSLDLKQTTTPIVNSQFIEFQSAFFFTPSNTHERPPFNPPVLPEISTNNNDIELMIHEYTLNSAGYFAFVQDKLDFTITHEMLQKDNKFNFTAEAFKWTIPGVYRKFGKDAKMNLGIESLFYPSIKIESNKLSGNIAALLDLQVRKPQFDANGNQLEDEIYSAITIDCELDISAKVFEENQVLKFSLESINFSKLEAFGAEVEPGILFRFFGHSTVNKILNLALPFINEHLFADKGIDLNRLLVKNVQISNIQISLNEGYIYTAADAMLV
ncbi:hypothetical protein ABPG72_009916 [Tetrahymena utriculariae]